MTLDLQSLDQLIADATLQPSTGVPRVVVLASDSSNLLYSGSGGFGELPTSSAPSAFSESETVTPDHIFGLASCTKLVTVIAALQLVEQGLIALDDDASLYVKELKDVKLFVGFGNNGEPILVENDTIITAEMLICHTSGFIFGEASPTATSVRKKLGLKSIFTSESTKDDILKMPLMFTPGTKWEYGTGNEWLGFLIESVSGLDLGEYHQKHIFSPLGITPSEMSFVAPPNKVRCATPPTPPSTHYTDSLGQVLSTSYKLGGAGLYGSPAAYIKILKSLLPSASPTLLRKETIDKMFEPHLRVPSMLSQVTAGTKDGSPFTLRKDEVHEGVQWGYGGALSGEKYDSGRGANSLFWAGYSSTHWFVDRENDVAFLIWSSIIPPPDKNLFELWDKVERELYRQLDGGK